MVEEEYFECADNTAANSIKAEPGSFQSDADSSILTAEALTTYLNSSRQGVLNVIRKYSLLV